MLLAPSSKARSPVRSVLVPSSDALCSVRSSIKVLSPDGTMQRNAQASIGQHGDHLTLMMVVVLLRFASAALAKRSSLV